MEVAIKYERVELGGTKVIFKPVSVIKGSYDQLNNVFETEYGQCCESIGTNDFYSDSFFGYSTDLERLKERYKLEDETELLACYFTEFGSNYYLGYIDSSLDKVNVVSISLASIENIYKDAMENKSNSTEENNIEEKMSGDVYLSIDDIKELYECDDLELIKDFFSQILELSGEMDIEIEEKIEEELEANTSSKIKKYSVDKEESKKMISLSDLRTEVKQSIIGQDKAVDDITRALIINNTSQNYRNRSHIFITGPSGTGKTEIVNIIAKKLDLPVFKANATEYSKSGYQGKEVNSMLAGLLEAAGGDLKKAQQGILIIDELDKVTLGNSADKSFDMAVLYALLKIMDRDVIEVEIGPYKSVLFDTSNLNIICMGAFSEYLKEKEKYKEKPMGFNAAESSTDVQKTRITRKDLIANFGVEFVGRLGMITSTDELDLENVIKIIYESKISQLLVIKEDLLNRGVELECDDGYVHEIAKLGSNKETGVRNLNSVIKENFNYAYDKVLLEGNAKKLVFTKETALDPKKYYVE